MTSSVWTTQEELSNAIALCFSTNIGCSIPSTDASVFGLRGTLHKEKWWNQIKSSLFMFFGWKSFNFTEKNFGRYQVGRFIKRCTVVVGLLQSSFKNILELLSSLMFSCLSVNFCCFYLFCFLLRFLAGWTGTNV